MKTLVIAPHPDDEILGCGGTLFRRKKEGGELAWIIVTSITTEGGWPSEQVKQRAQEIAKVADQLQFSRVFNFGLPSTRLDTLPLADLVSRFSDAFNTFEPEEILLPHPSDIHSDHRVVFEAACACTKWFRHPSIMRVLAYETLSETDFSIGSDHNFRPNYFIDIGAHLEQKLNAMATYRSEMGSFPFPRSTEALRALAAVRGAASGFSAAEAFQLLRERQ